jgi:MarR family transcriptional regulator, organic hydroperoxide resistance regulator
LDQQDLEPYLNRLETAFAKTMRKLGPALSENMPDLTGQQFHILHILFKKGKCTVTELSDMMCVKPSAITAIVDRLYKHKFVLRDRDEADRRVVYIQLSPEGAEVLEQAKVKRKQIIQRYLSCLDPEELEALVAIYEKIANSLPFEK